MFLFFSLIAHADEFCPINAYVGDGTNAVLYENQTSGVLTWDGSVTFEDTPYTPSAPEATSFTADMVNYGNNFYAWGAGIDVDGNLVTWGYGITPTTPSGGEPYASPDCGNSGKCVVLDGTGHVQTFFNGATGAFNTGRPTAGGLDVAAAGRENGCVADSDSATGVTCWPNTNNLANNPAKPGYGIQIAGIAVGRYMAVAWDVDGDTYCWGSRASAVASRVDEFCDNRPLNGVVDMGISETGEFYGIALYANGEAVVWEENDGTTTNPALTAAPGFDTYGSYTGNQYKIEGPDGYLTWRSIGINIYTAGSLFGVIENGQGLDESGEYLFGDAVAWNDAMSYPNVIGTCYE